MSIPSPSQKTQRNPFAALKKIGRKGRYAFYGPSFFYVAVVWCVALLFSWSSLGSILIDASSSTNLANASIANLTHSTAAGTNRLLLVGVSLDSGSSAQVSSITYSGQALTLVGARTDAGNTVRMEIWSLVNPPVGTANVAVTLSAQTLGFIVGASTFTGVHQTSPLGTFTSAQGNSTAPSVTVTSATNELVFDAVAGHRRTDFTAGTGQTILWSVGSSGNDVRGVASIKNGVPSTVMSWTSVTGASRGWAIGAVAIKPEPWADLRTTVTGPASATVGTSMSYTITVTNLGFYASSNVVVSDTLPAGATFVSASGSGTHNNGIVTWNFASLAPQQTTNLTLTIDAPKAAGIVTNRVSNTSSTEDPDPSNNNGSAASALCSTTLSPGPFQKLQILVPGETAAPGTISGITGTASAQSLAVPFDVSVRAVDAFWNLISTSDTVTLSASGPVAILPPSAALVAGRKTFSITLYSAGTHTVSATNVTSPAITGATSSPITVAKGAQTINFAAIPDQIETNTLTLSATASSGLPVSFAVTSGPASIANGTNLSFTGGGSVTITASQSGDSNWEAAPDVSRTFDVNSRPIPSSPAIQRWPLAGVKVRVADLLGTDPDGDSLSLQSVASSSAQGGTVSTNTVWVFFTPLAGFTNTDSFSYSVRDSRGAAGSGTVTVNITADVNPTLNYTMEDLGAGSVRIHFSGIAGRSYTIQYTDTSDGSVWMPLTTIVADASGVFTCDDTPPGPPYTRTYRTVHIAP